MRYYSVVDLFCGAGGLSLGFKEAKHKDYGFKVIAAVDVWKRACRLSVEIYTHFKENRDFSFKDQITRSSLSIASNIAEGMEKEYIKENIRFLEIAKGSTAELITQIYIGIEINYINKTKGFEWIKETNELLRMLNGLKKNLTIKDTK